MHCANMACDKNGYGANSHYERENRRDKHVYQRVKQRKRSTRKREGQPGLCPLGLGMESPPHSAEVSAIRGNSHPPKTKHVTSATPDCYCATNPPELSQIIPIPSGPDGLDTCCSGKLCQTHFSRAPPPWVVVVVDLARAKCRGCPRFGSEYP